MALTIEKLADEAAELDPAQFAEFLRRLTEERLKRGLPLELDEASLRGEDQLISQQTLAEDWDGVPDDWEAAACPSPEAK